MNANSFGSQPRLLSDVRDLENPIGSAVITVSVRLRSGDIELPNRRDPIPS